MAPMSRALVVGVALIVTAGASPGALAQAPQSGSAPYQAAQTDQPADLRARISAAIGQIQNACKDELKNFCGSVTPGEGRLMLCMQAHEDQLSQKCELTLYDASRSIASAVHRIERIAEACWNDIQTQCISTGHIGQCILNNTDSLSPSCRSVVTSLKQQMQSQSQNTQQQGQAQGQGQTQPQQARVQPASLNGMPIFSSDGVRLGQVTAAKYRPDGNLDMIQAEIGSALGLGTTSVLISPNEFDQRPDRLQLRVDAEKVWSLIQNRSR